MEETPLLPKNEPSNRKLAGIMSSVWVGTFLAALDMTVIATLTSPISATFKSFSALSWLATAYLIANSAFQPLAGRLTDIYSRKAGLLFSNTFFGIGTLICGLATSSGMIIAGRVIAGMGGGGLGAISTFIASDLVPLRRRGVWQGIGNISWGLGMTTGGIFGGWINDTWGWRWAFLSQVPPIVISTLLVLRLKLPGGSPGPVDYLGAFLLVSALVLLLFGLNAGGNTVPWTHPLVLVTLPVSAVVLCAFVFVESRVVAPIIPVRLLLNRTVAGSCLVNWLNTMALFAISFYVPIYFQVVMGLSASQSGLRLIPQSVGTAVGSLGAGVIMRWSGRYYWLNFGNAAIFTAAIIPLCTLSLATPGWVPLPSLFFSGMTYGAILTINLSALIAAVDHVHQAVITSASYAFRSTGATIGITVASTIFQNVLKGQLTANLKGFPDKGIVSKLRNNAEEIQRLQDPWRSRAQESYIASLQAVFFFCLGLSILSALVTTIMREHTLYSNLARTDEDEGESDN